MTVDWKKKLIPNLPYLLFVYLFDKLCQAVRLAPGLDASEKFLHLSQGFTEVFSSGLPSLHPLDLLAGIAGAVIVRLAVYAKSKNTKKYRKGIEYGSARWGTAADIAPLCRSGPRLEHSSDPDGKAHHVQPPEKLPNTPGTKTSWSSAAAAAARPGSSSNPPSCRCTVPMWSPIPKDSFCPRWGPCCGGAPQAGRERKAHAGCPREGHL